MALENFTFAPMPCFVGTMLEHYIVQNGGHLLDETERNKEFTIQILDVKYFKDHPLDNFTLPPDTFSSVFIYDFVSAVGMGDKELPKLQNYRLTDTNYVDVDVDKILWKEKNWKEFTLIDAHVAYSKVTAQEVVKEWELNDQIESDSSIDVLPASASGQNADSGEA